MKTPKLYLNQRQADAMLKAYPSLEGTDTIVVIHPATDWERQRLIDRLNEQQRASTITSKELRDIVLPKNPPQKFGLWGFLRFAEKAG